MRCRRFSVLVYVDQSTPERGDIVERRLEMADWLPEVFPRYIEVCRQHQRAP